MCRAADLGISYFRYLLIVDLRAFMCANLIIIFQNSEISGSQLSKFESKSELIEVNAWRWFKYLASAIHWHIRPCSSVVYVEYTPSSHQQLCSMADRLCFNRFYGTGS